MDQTPAANQTLDSVPRIKAYRYPAPGSQPPPAIPREEIGKDIFDAKHYSRDYRRAPKERPIIKATRRLTKEDIAAIEAGDQPKEGSTGKFGNPAVFEYDPTGLRSSMTATHEALEAELDKHKPTQLPHFAWEDNQDAIVAEYEAKGLPVPPGQPFKWKVPPDYYKAKW